jgi:hypothetical protein
MFLYYWPEGIIVMSRAGRETGTGDRLGVSLLEHGKVKEIEEKIAELKARWPSHSVPPVMWEELEDLEMQLADARKSDEGTEDAG